MFTFWVYCPCYVLQNLSFNHRNPKVPKVEQLLKPIIINTHNRDVTVKSNSHWINKKPNTGLSSLPDYRVSYYNPFEVTDVEYAGLLFVWDRHFQCWYMKKCCILLLTCASTRCVHLELFIDCKWQTSAFLLKTFISRRVNVKLDHFW